MYWYARHAARFSRLPLNTRTAKYAAWQLPAWLAMVVVVLLLGTRNSLRAANVGRQSGMVTERSIQRTIRAKSAIERLWRQPGSQPYYPDSGRAYPQQGYGQGAAQAQPLTAVQLEQLVAPIALYPDALVAQVLAASTYPGQVADADQWRQAQGYASPDQVAAGADVQNWDPSVKALTAFPQVLALMGRNLQWTTDLGNAYYNQPQDVFEAVQVMRQRAQAAGTLQSTPQQAVRNDQGYIQLMPVNPQVVYVPTYNPWTVYGEQVSPYPGFSLLGAVRIISRLVANQLWARDRDERLQPHALGLAGVGYQLASSGRALPPVGLLFAQHHRS